MSYESRPSNGVGFLVGMLPFGLISLVLLCSMIDVLNRAFDLGFSRGAGMFGEAAGHLPPLLLIGGGGIGSMAWLFFRATKKRKEWEAGGGEERLANQTAAHQAAHAQAEAQQLAELAARGIRMIVPYPIRPAATELERYVDSVVGPTLRQGEVILDRAYGTRGSEPQHFLVCVTNMRFCYIETTFLGFTPAPKCLSLENVELQDLVNVQWATRGIGITGIGLVKRDGTTVGVSVSSALMNTGFSDQGGFVSRAPAWAKRTVDALLAGTPLAGHASAAASPTAPVGHTPPAAAQVAVWVRWPDGSTHTAAWVKSNGDQTLCRFADGSERWVPTADVAAAAGAHG